MEAAQEEAPRASSNTHIQPVGYVHTAFMKCRPALGLKVPSLPVEETCANGKLVCFFISRCSRTDAAEVNQAFQ